MRIISSLTTTLSIAVALLGSTGDAAFFRTLVNRSSLDIRQQCGSVPGACNQNGCQGTNGLYGETGICNGNFQGCACASVCGFTSGPCNQNSCQGINALGGQLGVCTAGDFNGCQCASVCGATNGPCNSNGCEGVNGVCTAGDFNGCACN
ncbi:hypothetical protein B7463_g2663, partial [Scytalidium lignicola]